MQIIDLDEAEPIVQMIATFGSATTGEAEGHYQAVGEPAISDVTTLRAVLFDPLLPAIGNRKRPLLAPDGDLTRLPFEVLPTDDGRP